MRSMGFRASISIFPGLPGSVSVNLSTIPICVVIPICIVFSETSGGASESTYRRVKILGLWAFPSAILKYSDGRE
jgi:hypothetical protein